MNASQVALLWMCGGAGFALGLMVMAWLASQRTDLCGCCGEEKDLHACRECMNWIADQVKEGA